MNPHPLAIAAVWTLLAGCAAAAPLSLPPAPSQPILVPASVTGKDAAAFAARLAALLGAPVRLPQTLKTVPVLPSGRYTPESLLADVRKQVNRAGEQGDWRETFVFQPASKNTLPTPPSRLRSLGSVTLDARDASFADLAHQVVKAADGSVELPNSVPGRYSLHETNAPVEQALADLAAQAGLTVTPTLVFSFAPVAASDPPPTDSAPETDEERAQKQAEAQVVALGRDQQEFQQRAARLQAITGMDPDSPGFNILAITPPQWNRLGLSPDALSQFRNDLVIQRQEQRATEALSQQELDQLSDPGASSTP